MLRVLLIVFFLFVSQQDDPQKAGLQALDHGDYQTAVQIFSKLTASDPKDYASFFNLALAETSLHRDEQAITHFRTTLDLKPNLYEAELNLGILLLRNARSAEAVPLLQDASRQRPKEVRPKRYLADALLAQSDLPAAVAAYQQVLELDSKLAVAHLGVGQALLRQNKLDEALPHYRQAAELDPKLQSFLVELAGAFEKANRSAYAISLLKDVAPTPAIEEELGRLYLATGQAAEAVSTFSAVVAQSPTSANQLALATAYLKNNQPALAAPLLDKALATSPNDFDLRMVVGRIRRDRHDYRAAASEFVTAAGIRPDSVEAWNETVSAYVLSEQYPQAIAALDKIHALSAETTGDFYYRAISLDKLHQIKPAIASYHHFLELANGKFPDQEFNARQRSKTLEHEVNR